MNVTLGRITARLADPTEPVADNLVDLINRNINPPTPVSASDVFMRVMYVVSDEVNSFGGRFPPEEHTRLAQLLVDSPVIVGHRKDKLPIARNFHAEVVSRQGQSWVKSYFYWLKSAEGSENLRENIDGGIYKECSIGFTFQFPECSICGKDIRTCQHEPFAEYDEGASRLVCHFNYRQIERVLETSLVYRGAVPDTSVTKVAGLGGGEAATKDPVRADVSTYINDLTCLDNEQMYLVTPFYEGLSVTAELTGEALCMRRTSGESLPPRVTERFGALGFPAGSAIPGQLVAYRGKERLSREQLEKYLAGRSTPVSRLELKLFPRDDLDLSRLSKNDLPDRMSVIRHRIVRVAGVDAAARSLMTRRGVRLWPLDKLPAAFCGYRYRPADGSKSVYTVTILDGDHCRLSFTDGKCNRRFVIRQFSQARLARGARFIADAADDPPKSTSAVGSENQHGQLLALTQREGSYHLTLSGILNGRFVLRPMRLGGSERYLFYRTTTGS
ncbi:MAG: hypothetical protein KAU35_09310 [candidate division Zixibacteria bacterium]|nr:hypothetical protein [candidate division Zixibacteria bacterium]